MVENSLRYNPETEGWRLTLRLKIKDPGKSTELRAALVKDIVAAEPIKASSQVVKADKVAAKTQEKHEKHEKDVAKAADKDAAKAPEKDKAKDKKEHDAPAPAAEAAPTTPEPAKTEQVLTET